jgi:hypothetical protein
MIAGQNEVEIREERFAGKIKKLSPAQIPRLQLECACDFGQSQRLARVSAAHGSGTMFFSAFARMELTKLNSPPR